MDPDFHGPEADCRALLAVIEGDQQTSRDADRIRETGARAVQVNTGKGCHLDGHMVAHALESLAPDNDSVLFIENVGNLVCPAGFDLGEAALFLLDVCEPLGRDRPTPRRVQRRPESVLRLFELLELVEVLALVLEGLPSR